MIIRKISTFCRHIEISTFYNDSVPARSPIYNSKSKIGNSASGWQQCCVGTGAAPVQREQLGPVAPTKSAPARDDEPDETVADSALLSFCSPFARRPLSTAGYSLLRENGEDGVVYEDFALQTCRRFALNRLGLFACGVGNFADCFHVDRCGFGPLLRSRDIVKRGTIVRNTKRSKQVARNVMFV